MTESNWFLNTEADIEMLRALLVSSVPARSVVAGVGTTAGVNIAPVPATVAGVGVLSAACRIGAGSTVAGVGATTAAGA